LNRRQPTDCHWELHMKYVTATCRFTLGLLLLACAWQAHGNTFPDRPLRIVVPSAAGGSPDAMMRLLAAELSISLGQPITVDNKPGQGGQIGMKEGLSAAADGYTLTYANVGTLAINKALYTQLSYDPDKGITPVALVAFTQNALVAKEGSAFRTLGDVLAFAKKNPGKLTIASAGAGTTGHLAGELLKSRTGVDLTHVPYPGSKQAIEDLTAGKVDLLFDNLASIGAQIRSGKVKAIALSGEKRSRITPGVPTVAESGMMGFAAVAWGGLVAPAGTPHEIVMRLNTEINKVLDKPETQEKFAAIGFEVYTGPPQALTGVARLETPRWAAMVKQAGITPK
jgi:tripartite-type tricarboxylate transporter receptor subunit TctC